MALTPSRAAGLTAGPADSCSATAVPADPPRLVTTAARAERPGCWAPAARAAPVAPSWWQARGLAVSEVAAGSWWAPAGPAGPRAPAVSSVPAAAAGPAGAASLPEVPGESAAAAGFWPEPAA